VIITIPEKIAEAAAVALIGSGIKL